MASDSTPIVDGRCGKSNKEPIATGRGGSKSKFVSDGRNITKTDKIKIRQAKRLAENIEYLKNTNVKAFIYAISIAEGGKYNIKYGGKIFSDFSKHPGPGAGGVSTPAGRYQITKPTWNDYGIKAMGLKDFSATTQDLIAIERLRSINAIDNIIEGDIDTALNKASKPWAALPQGQGMPNRYPKQPHYMKYDKFVEIYKSNGGTVK